MNDFAAEAGTGPASPFVSANAISKAYGGAQALKGVSLSILPGEVHGLVGANGAGKSTLIRVLAGLTQPDAGEIRVDGKRVAITTPHQAGELGMSFIHQELAFVPGMTVLENIMLGLPKRTRFGVVDWPAIAREIAPIAERVGVRAPLGANVKGLSTAENWLINITRALVRKSRLIVMDEPTAALSPAESERLFAIIRDLRQSGVAVLYVSHRLDEILELCQRVTVFRDGLSVAELAGAALTRQTLVEAIVGGAIVGLQKSATPVAAGEVALSVRGLARPPKVVDVSFELNKGEVLGLGGLVGAGRSETARLLFGADRPDTGAMTLNGAPFAPKEPGRGGQGRTWPRAGGTARRGPDPDEKPRLQCRTRQPQFDRRRRDAAADQRPKAQGAGGADDPRPRDQDAGRRYPGRATQRRQSAEGGHRALASVAAERADP